MFSLLLKTLQIHFQTMLHQGILNEREKPIQIRLAIVAQRSQSTASEFQLRHSSRLRYHFAESAQKGRALGHGVLSVGGHFVDQTDAQRFVGGEQLAEGQGSLDIASRHHIEVGVDEKLGRHDAQQRFVQTDREFGAHDAILAADGEQTATGR